MLPGRLSDVDEAYLVAIANERWPESGTLDFKQTLPSNDDRSRQEFLKDVCAFANANGGDLIFGIADDHGSAARLEPIDIVRNAIDGVKRRLGQILEGGIEPRLDGVTMHAVPVTGGYVLLLRVQQSFRRPHRSRWHSYWRWPVRADTHIVDLTYEQIRDAFDQSATMLDRARRFRDARLAGVLSDSNGRQLRAGPRCVVHLVPLAALAGNVTIDVGQLYYDYQPFMLRNSGWGGASRTLNLDGLAVHPGGDGAKLAYVQIFRSGILESARYVGAVIPDPDFQDTIPSGVVADLVHESLHKFLEAANRWRIAGPGIAAAALLDIGDFRFLYQPANRFTERARADRPNLVLPEILIEQINAASADEIARTLLDTMWQSFDLERCEFYDNDGRWMRR